MSGALYHPPCPENEKVLSYSSGSPEKLRLKKTLVDMSQKTLEIPLVLGGKKISGRQTRQVTAPHKKDLILARSQEATEEDVDLAINSALSAWQEWSRLDWQERAAVFLKAADLITGKYREKINAATMLGQSKTCYQAEIEAACELADFLRFNVHYASELYQQQPMYSAKGQWNKMRARPLEGFVFAIAPFNFTAISLNLACAPALMGCTVVWKPAPTAVLSSYYGLQALEEAGLPPGVINFITGDAELIGNKILRHPSLSGVHFTGSTKTFQSVWKTVAANLENYRTYPRIVGETGGKDFVFAHPSADPDQLVTALIRGSFEYQGQKCSAASRAYIPESLWNKMRDKLISQTKSLAMGDPSDFTNFLCAVIDERSFQKIKSYLEHAQASNEASIICGGECDDKIGYFVRPTIIETTNALYKTMKEEIFGPVLTVFVYKDDQFEETLALCESTGAYALTGAIFARDRRVLNKMTETLTHAAGNFYVNDKPTGAVVGQQPFGGGRASGTNDKSGSSINLLRWVSYQTIKENFLPITDHTYPHMQES